MKRYLSRKIILVMAAMLIFLTTACTKNSAEVINLPPESDEYDAVLKSGDDYHIVMKHIDEFSGAYDMVGVVNSKGEWIHNLSKKHPFIKQGTIMKAHSTIVVNLTGSSSISEESVRISDIQQCLRYVGEGMFMLHYSTNFNNENSYILLNAETGEGTNVDVCYDMTGFHDGYMIACADRKVNSNIKIIDRHGVITHPGISTNGGELGIYAEGMFFGGQNFYYIDGTLAIDLSDYKIINNPYFQDGKSYLEIENNAGTVFYTEIDCEGNILFDPVAKKD